MHKRMIKLYKAILVQKRKIRFEPFLGVYPTVYKVEWDMPLQDDPTVVILGENVTEMFRRAMESR